MHSMRTLTLLEMWVNEFRPNYVMDNTVGLEP
jgi:hypothetical protein